MNFIQNLFPTEVLQAIGWTLLHSLWQAVVLALLLAAVLTIWKKKVATLRYAATVSTLGLLIVSFICTFIISYEPASQMNTMAFIGEQGALLENQSWLAWLADYFQHNMPLLVLLWFFGVSVLGLRFLGEIAYTYHLKNYQVKVVSSTWQEQTQAIAQSIGLKRSIIIKETFRVNTPMVVGIFKPVILMPIGLLSGLSNAQIESILAHELAHIRRHDFVINLFQSFIEVLLFFNPAVWWISACVRAERENCCDDLAIQITGDASIYIKTLAQLEEMRSMIGNTAVAFAGQGGVLQRIRRILYQKSSTPVLSKGFWSACVMMICLFLAVFNLESQTLAETEDFSIEEFEPSVFEEIQNEDLKSELINTLPENTSSTEVKKKSPDLAEGNTPLEVPQKLSSIQLSTLLAKASLPMLRDTVPNDKEKLARKRQAEAEKRQYQEAKEAYEKALKEMEKKEVKELTERMKALEMELKESVELAKEKQEAIKQGRIQQFEMELQARDEELKMQAERMQLEQKLMEEEIQHMKEQKELEIQMNKETNAAHLEKARRELEAAKKEMSEEEWKDQVEILNQEEKQMALEEARVHQELARELKQALSNQQRQAAVAQLEIARAKKEIELQQRQFSQELKLEEMQMQAAQIEELKHRQADELMQIKSKLQHSMEEMKLKLEKVERELKAREQSKKKGTIH